jgi:hypothetical protein
MKKLLAALAVCALAWCTSVAPAAAGPHGCYRSQGCH